MRRHTLLLVVLLIMSPSGTATPRPDCLEEKFGRYVDAQDVWQRGLTRLIVTTYPHFSDVAQRYLDDQLVRIELRRRAVSYQVTNVPQEIKPGMPLRRWGLPDESGEAEIANADPRYAQLLRQKQQARDLPPHADGDALREVMRTEVMQMPDYTALIETLTKDIDAAEAMTCQSVSGS